LLVVVTRVVSLTSVPPAAAVNQPSNVWPVRVTVASVPYWELWVTFLLAGKGVPPPLPLKVTVWTLGV